MSHSNPMHRHTPVVADLYAEVTQQVITALEAGTVPWTCPWTLGQSSLLPANLTSGRRYRGINVLLLNLRQLASGYTHSRWLTFQQAHAVGARVRKGETGTRIVFFKLLEREGAPDRAPRAANDEPQRKVVPLLRSFTVFNEDQIDDLPSHLRWPEPPTNTWTPCDAAQQVLDTSGAQIRHGGERAYYSPALDHIQLPPATSFIDAEGYYSVALHELTHWTGHSSRCDRPLLGRQHIEAYAFEELVAEMGSAFLTSHCGLPGVVHHASYIQAWLAALRNDKRLVFSAAALAQKAVDFLLPEEATQSGESTDAAHTTKQANFQATIQGAA